jgi:hypothetical protein
VRQQLSLKTKGFLQFRLCSFRKFSCCVPYLLKPFDIRLSRLVPSSPRNTGATRRFVFRSRFSRQRFLNPVSSWSVEVAPVVGWQSLLKVLAQVLTQVRHQTEIATPIKDGGESLQERLHSHDLLRPETTAFPVTTGALDVAVTIRGKIPPVLTGPMLPPPVPGNDLQAPALAQIILRPNRNLQWLNTRKKSATKCTPCCSRLAQNQEMSILPKALISQKLPACPAKIFNSKLLSPLRMFKLR